MSTAQDDIALIEHVYSLVAQSEYRSEVPQKYLIPLNLLSLYVSAKGYNPDDHSPEFLQKFFHFESYVPAWKPAIFNDPAISFTLYVVPQLLDLRSELLLSRSDAVFGTGERAEINSIASCIGEQVADLLALFLATYGPGETTSLFKRLSLPFDYVDKFMPTQQQAEERYVPNPWKRSSFEARKNRLKGQGARKIKAILETLTNLKGSTSSESVRIILPEFATTTELMALIRRFRSNEGCNQQNLENLLLEKVGCSPVQSLDF